MRARLLACIPQVCVRACAPSTRAVIASGCCRPPTHTAPPTPPHPTPSLPCGCSTRPTRAGPAPAAACVRRQAARQAHQGAPPGPQGPPAPRRRPPPARQARPQGGLRCQTRMHPPPARAHTQTIHTQRTHTKTGTHTVWLFRLSASLFVCLCVCVSVSLLCLSASVSLLAILPCPPNPASLPASPNPSPSLFRSLRLGCVAVFQICLA